MIEIKRLNVRVKNEADLQQMVMNVSGMLNQGYIPYMGCYDTKWKNFDAGHAVILKQRKSTDGNYYIESYSLKEEDQKYVNYKDYLLFYREEKYSQMDGETRELIGKRKGYEQTKEDIIRMYQQTMRANVKAAKDYLRNQTPTLEKLDRNIEAIDKQVIKDVKHQKYDYHKILSYVSNEKEVRRHEGRRKRAIFFKVIGQILAIPGTLVGIVLFVLGKFVSSNESFVSMGIAIAAACFILGLILWIGNSIALKHVASESHEHTSVIKTGILIDKKGLFKKDAAEFVKSHKAVMGSVPEDVISWLKQNQYLQ